jgi:hypothetical protein
MFPVKPLKFLLPVTGLCTLLAWAQPGWAASCRSDFGSCVTPAVRGKTFSMAATAFNIVGRPAEGQSRLIDAATGRFIRTAIFVGRWGPRIVSTGGRTRSLKCAVQAIGRDRVSCTLTAVRA